MIVDPKLIIQRHAIRRSCTCRERLLHESVRTRFDAHIELVCALIPERVDCGYVGGGGPWVEAARFKVVVGDGCGEGCRGASLDCRGGNKNCCCGHFGDIICGDDLGSCGYGERDGSGYPDMSNCRYCYANSDSVSCFDSGSHSGLNNGGIHLGDGGCICSVRSGCGWDTDHCNKACCKC